MNMPSRMTVGASSSMARSRSLSRKRVSARGRVPPAWASATSIPAAPPEPPEIGARAVRPSRPGAPPSPVLPVGVVIDSLVLASSLGLADLLELGFGVLHGVLGAGALHALGVHVGDDVLGEGLGGL